MLDFFSKLGGTVQKRRGLLMHWEKSLRVGDRGKVIKKPLRNKEDLKSGIKEGGGGF